MNKSEIEKYSQKRWDCVKKLQETKGRRQTSMPLDIYIKIYIYLSSLLYDSSIPDIQHSPNYIALASPRAHKMI